MDLVASQIVGEQVAWVKAVAASGEKSVESLLQQARPPAWKFWVGEVHRAAAVYVLSGKAKNDPRLVPCYCEVLKRDPSQKVRQLVVTCLLELVANSAVGSRERKSAVYAFIESLSASQSQEVATSIIRALGILGERDERKQDAVTAIRSFGQYRMQDPSKVEPRLLLWTSFALAALSDDPSGPLEALRKFIEEDIGEAVRKAAKSAPEIEVVGPDQIGLVIALAHAVDYELVSEQMIDSKVRPHLKVTKKIVAAEVMVVAKRIVEALEAAARLGPRARPLLPSIRRIQASNPPQKMRAAVEQALRAIETGAGT